MTKYKNLEKFRKKIAKSYSIGTWMQIPSVDIALILSSLNFDWVTLDLEHGSFNDENICSIIDCIQNNKKLAFIRLLNDNYHTACKYLDLGASGLVIPNIQNKKQLDTFIKGVQYPPNGSRGVGFSRSNIFGQNFNKKHLINFKPIIIAMIESINSIKNLEEILSTRYLDGIIVGPYDLSCSIGDIGNFKNLTFKKNIKKIYDVCKNKNVPFGIHVMNNFKKEIKSLVHSGGRIIPVGTDALFIYKGQEI